MDNVDLEPLRIADRSKGFPTDPAIMQAFYHMERRWTLDQPKKLLDETNGYPDRIQGTVAISGAGNIKELCELVRMSLKRKGIHIFYKPVQKKQSASVLTLLGAPGRINVAGLEQTLHHHCKKSQDYLIRHQVLPFDLVNEPLPLQKCSFRRHKEDRMSPRDHDRLKYSNVKGYSKKEGISMFTIEQDPADWPLMSMV